MSIDENNHAPLAAHVVDAELLKLLVAEACVLDRRPDRMAKVEPLVTEALHIAAKAHDRGGATPGQSKRMCELVDEVQQIAK